MASRLQLPEGSLIHPVFHVSQLKPFIADYTPVYDTLPVTTDLEAATAKPQAILERRLVEKGNTAIPQVKVTWTGLPTSATTWEDYHVIKKRFPDAPAWGQAASQGGRCRAGRHVRADKPCLVNRWRKHLFTFSNLSLLSGPSV